MTVDKQLDTVKRILDLYEAGRKNLKPGEAIPRYVKEIESLKELQEYLTGHKRSLLLPPDGIGDILDLPDELIEQLSVKKPDELEQQIISVMRALGGEKLSLDQILVGLFRAYRRVHERRLTQQKLYRMNERGFTYQDDEIDERGMFSLQERYRLKKEPPPKPKKDDLDDDIPF
jgi:hypothetical protein